MPTGLNERNQLAPLGGSVLDFGGQVPVHGSPL